MGQCCSKKQMEAATRSGTDLAVGISGDIDLPIVDDTPVDPNDPPEHLLLRAGLLPRCRKRTETLRRCAELGNQAARAWVMVYGQATNPDGYASSDDGKDVFDGDAERGVAELRRLSSGGDLFATFTLAKCLLRGSGTKRNVEEGAALLVKAANGGELGAKCFAGRDYIDGTNGSRRDPKKGGNMLNILAKQGHVGAKWELARGIADGKITGTKEREGVLLLECANAGVKRARARLLKLDPAVRVAVVKEFLQNKEEREAREGQAWAKLVELSAKAKSSKKVTTKKTRGGRPDDGGDVVPDHGDQEDPYGNEDPYGGYDDPYGGYDDPYGGNDDPYGGNDDPYGGYDDPYGGNDDPYGNNDDPYGNNDDPYGGDGGYGGGYGGYGDQGYGGDDPYGGYGGY